MREWTERGRRESLTRGLCEHDGLNVSQQLYFQLWNDIHWYYIILYSTIIENMRLIMDSDNALSQNEYWSSFLL